MWAVTIYDQSDDFVDCSISVRPFVVLCIYKYDVANASSVSPCAYVFSATFTKSRIGKYKTKTFSRIKWRENENEIVVNERRMRQHAFN